jgi:hypothetical protein
VVVAAGGLEASFAVSQDDHGDARTSATVWTMPAGSVASTGGTLGTASDLDYFRFVAPVTGGYWFVSAVAGAGGVEGHLYSSAGALLASGDNSAGSGVFRITHPLTARTTYYLAVRHPSTPFGAPVEYSVTGGIPMLTLAPESAQFGREGGSATTTVATTLPGWTIVSHPSWLSVSQAAGIHGAVLTVTAAATATGLERAGTVVLSAGEEQAVFEVTQDDHGNSISTASDWALAASGPSAASGALPDIMDTDYFRIVAPASGRYVIRSDTAPVRAVYGSLLNSAGEQLAGNYNGVGNGNFQITYTLTAGVTYYVGIRLFNQFEAAPTAYTITITR